MASPCRRVAGQQAREQVEHAVFRAGRDAGRKRRFRDRLPLAHIVRHAEQRVFKRGKVGADHVDQPVRRRGRQGDAARGRALFEEGRGPPLVVAGELDDPFQLAKHLVQLGSGFRVAALHEQQQRRVRHAGHIGGEALFGVRIEILDDHDAQPVEKRQRLAGRLHGRARGGVQPLRVERPRRIGHERERLPHRLFLAVFFFAVQQIGAGERRGIRCGRLPDGLKKAQFIHDPIISQSPLPRNARRGARKVRAFCCAPPARAATCHLSGRAKASILTL